MVSTLIIENKDKFKRYAIDEKTVVKIEELLRTSNVSRIDDVMKSTTEVNT